ncbi:MAG: ABC-type antimicrobial peptide transport system, permease component, partial [uncultured Rubrobacteraceae bacterium]
RGRALPVSIGGDPALPDRGRHRRGPGCRRIGDPAQDPDRPPPGRRDGQRGRARLRGLRPDRRCLRRPSRLPLCPPPTRRSPTQGV